MFFADILGIKLILRAWHFFHDVIIEWLKKSANLGNSWPANRSSPGNHGDWSLYFIPKTSFEVTICKRSLQLRSDPTQNRQGQTCSPGSTELVKPTWITIFDSTAESKPAFPTHPIFMQCVKLTSWGRYLSPSASVLSWIRPKDLKSASGYASLVSLLRSRVIDEFWRLFSSSLSINTELQIAETKQWI